MGMGSEPNPRQVTFPGNVAEVTTDPVGEQWSVHDQLGDWIVLERDDEHDHVIIGTREQTDDTTIYRLVLASYVEVAGRYPKVRDASTSFVESTAPELARQLMEYSNAVAEEEWVDDE